MLILAICPVCSKTISVERVPKVSCPDCGAQFGFSELQRKRLVVDKHVEAAELATAKDFFTNGEFLSASEHFKRALVANKNCYSAVYFVKLCNIYLHEVDTNSADKDSFDVMSAVVEMIEASLLTLSRANVTVANKLAFITAMLAETKIIISRRLTTRDELFENDIDAYRKVSVADLTKLMPLFKIDREQIMSFAPEVSKALSELVDCAIKVCYKAVQTVAVGEDIFSPNDADYKKLSALCNDLCFFGHTFDPKFDANSYSPDFTQNYMLNEKVLSRFAKFDEENKANVKKNVIGDINEYDDILAECVKALKFTYLNCYRSMCSRQVKQHAQLFLNGFDMLYRLLMPRVVIADKKRTEVRSAKFVDITDWCDMLTRFLVDSYELDEDIDLMLHNYYEKLYEIVSIYIVPEIGRLSKCKDKSGILAYQKVLFDCACCCAPALHKYVDFSTETDKVRNRLVKICKAATEEFLLHSGLSIDEIEQSNFYRPILQISTAAADEDNE